jgi:uridine kinase
MELMNSNLTKKSPDEFSYELFGLMQQINPAVQEMELYEFRYALHNLFPGEGGWDSIPVDEIDIVEKTIQDSKFYASIQIKPRVDDRIVLDPQIVRLSQMLFVGLVTGKYPVDWVKRTFNFDLRGFYFQVRTIYFTDAVKAHFGGKPYRQFEPKQQAFEYVQSVGYKEFKEANQEVDSLFIDCVQKLITIKGTPILMAIAGPTAAGKTEIVDRLREAFAMKGKAVTTIEMDNFLTDRDYREAHGIHTMGAQAIHYSLLKQALQDILKGKWVCIPRYDFVYATSSHDLDGNLKPDGVPLDIPPADIVFIEGNFPFLLKEIAPMIGIKVVYLTDDPVRMKRKWRRDIDYRKKYEPTYFRNRFFKDQFLMAEFSYRPQMELCDILVDTTGAALWMTQDIIQLIES